MTPQENRDKLKAEALKRADILNASAAWGTDWDAHLLTALVRRVDELEGALSKIADFGSRHRNPGYGFTCSEMARKALIEENRHD